MAEKKVTRKVITKRISENKAAPQKESVAPVKEASEEVKQSVRVTKKVCNFCQNKKPPTYTDMATLKRYVTDRAKIVSHLRNSLCSKHQRVACKQIKYARHLGLLPFVPKI